MSPVHVHPIREVWTAHDEGDRQKDLVEAVRFRLRALATVVSLGSLLYLGLGFSAWANWAGADTAAAASETTSVFFALRVITTLLSVAGALAVFLVSWYAKYERTLEWTGMAFTLGMAALAGLGRPDMLVNLDEGSVPASDRAGPAFPCSWCCSPCSSPSAHARRWSRLYSPPASTWVDVR